MHMLAGKQLTERSHRCPWILAGHSAGQFTQLPQRGCKLSSHATVSPVKFRDSANIHFFHIMTPTHDDQECT